MAFSPALWLYLALTARGASRGRRILQRRLAEGREDPERIGEREGRASLPRPDGRLIWFHAASVGESLSLLEVIRRLGEHDKALNFLITTGTVSSAGILAARLPDRCQHQFVPLDIGPFVQSFLDHWHPDLAVWTESEFWPGLILSTEARGIPVVLVNARMSERSARRWRWLPGAARRIVSAFRAVQAQDDVTAAALRDLGVPPERLAVTGTLKEGMPPLPCNEVERVRLSRKIGDRPVWAATSTHPGEEEIVAEAQARASQSVLRLMVILAPRHAERGDAIAAALRARGCNVAQRSAGQDPQPETTVYLADTLGELGLWYRLAPVSFVGGSLVDKGGHNPFEPAALGSAIIHGPHVRNFADIYARLDAAGAARQVRDVTTLVTAVTDLSRPDRRAPMAYAAWELSSSGADVTDKALALILDHLPGSRAG